MTARRWPPGSFIVFAVTVLGLATTGQVLTTWLLFHSVLAAACVAAVGVAALAMVVRPLRQSSRS